MTAPPESDGQERERVAQVAAAVAAIAAYQQTTARLRRQVENYVRNLWRSLRVYRDVQMADFVAQVVPVVLAAQQQMVSLTAASMAAQKAAALGVPVRPEVINPKLVTGPAVRNGTPMQTVYERPFHLTWRQLGEAKDANGRIDSPDKVANAIQAGADRAVQSALTDIQLAKTHTAKVVLERDKLAIGYRRVLEGAYSCALCVVASTQRYHIRTRQGVRRAGLLPLHPGCDCSCATLWADRDPGRVINEGRLEAAHQLIQDTFGMSARDARKVDYRKVLIDHIHHELGPTFGIRGRPHLVLLDDVLPSAG